MFSFKFCQCIKTYFLFLSSSRLSVNTNPFESDDDEMDDAHNASRTSTLSISSKTPRKKRRAPAPPVPVS